MDQKIVLIKGKTDAFKNMPLGETLKWIEKISCHLASEVDFLKKFEIEYADVIGDLLTVETINRFKGIAITIKYPYQSYRSHPDYNTKEMLAQGLQVQSWAALGSLLESTLQMFLSFNYRYYIESEWYKWDEKAINQIKEVLKGSFKENLEGIIKQNEASGEKGITNDIKKSFLKRIKDILKLKSDLPKIERITLSDLIDFYFDENVLRSNDYGKEDFQKIRDYRNVIHSFQKREIGSWDEYNNYLKHLIMLTIDMLYRLPDIPDNEPIPQWYIDGKTEIIMIEKKWFDYRLGVSI